MSVFRQMNIIDGMGLSALVIAAIKPSWLCLVLGLVLLGLSAWASSLDRENEGE